MNGPDRIWGGGRRRSGRNRPTVTFPRRRHDWKPQDLDSWHHSASGEHEEEDRSMANSPRVKSRARDGRRRRRACGGGQWRRWCSRWRVETTRAAPKGWDGGGMMQGSRFYSPKAVLRKEGGRFGGGFGRWRKESFVPAAWGRGRD
jgi:hypothetical protein